MKHLRFRSQLWIAVLLWLGPFDVAEASLKVYFIRHAEAGHNVVKDWKGKPKDQWPAYVGNPDMFTPKGERQVVKATDKLKQYHFDFIGVSPVWRTRHTVLPYLKETGAKAELWPELTEFDHFSTNLTSGLTLPHPSADLFTSGDVIAIAEQEKGSFILREDGRRLFNLDKEPRQVAADVTAVAEKTVSLVRQRFGGSDKSILLVGHGNSGRLLLHVLLKNSDAWKTQLANTGIWMVEEQTDGSFKLRLLNDTPVKH
jgi:broad specificity phosphatase PhoE